jgi:hypothetical protein
VAAAEAPWVAEVAEVAVAGAPWVAEAEVALPVEAAAAPSAEVALPVEAEVAPSAEVARAAVALPAEVPPAEVAPAQDQQREARPAAVETAVGVDAAPALAEAVTRSAGVVTMSAPLAAGVPEAAAGPAG